ncbi:MAG TPA: YggS family pyridoxal phosphate-dependent enzyme [Pyrinomonadaceae bacterium]|nr:YggS family pyridoxal phosphate-dependent enzyme [Pyrinomonadaceae bacterium]
MPTADTATLVTDLRTRLQDVHNRIEAAARRSGRAKSDIRLIAISKTHPVEIIQEAITLGATELGENRVQEAESKIQALGNQARWHMVGHLQANKARKAIKLFDVIHSLDSIDLAERLNDICEQEGRSRFSVLLQVDLGREATKSGIAEEELVTLAERTRELTHLKLEGLMTLPPFFDEPEKARPYFAKLRKLRDNLAKEGFFDERPGELSMGMTNDFEVAIAEGATMVRVGTAIFGERGTPR